MWEKKRFLQDPHAFAKNLFNPPQAGAPTFTKEVAEAYFSDVCGDDNREYEYTAPSTLPRPPPPKVPFNCVFPSFDNFSKICWRKRNKSAPGCNGISYQVYKFCPKVRTILWEILKRVWYGNVIPSVWQIARIREIPKSSDTSHPSLMRPISVLNAEGRLFFTIYQEYMAAYMLRNGYITQSVQKAFLESVAGCIEHTTLLAEAFRDAHERRRSIYMCCLD